MKTLLFALATFAATLCPTSVQVKQQLTAPVAGWIAGSDGMPHQLAGLTFYDGKPEEKASLAPDSHVNNISTWKLDAARPAWVECHYAGTDVTLTRELPRGTSVCVVTYKRNETIAGLPVIESVDCKSTSTK